MGIVSNLHAGGPRFEPHSGQFFLSSFFLTYPRPKKLLVYPLSRPTSF